MRPLGNQERDVADTRRLWNESQQATRSTWHDPVRIRFDEQHSRSLTSELAVLAADLTQASDAFAAILASL